MDKTLLLTKSNLRKNRGTTIGLFLLMFISTCLIGISLMIFFDAIPTASKEAVRLKAGDGYIVARNGIKDMTDEKIGELIKDDTDEYYVFKNLQYTALSLPFGSGNVSIDTAICNSSAFDKKMDKMEVVLEDASVKDNYIYLPYQFYTSGGKRLNDKFVFTLEGVEYNFTIKGFTAVTYGGCNNTALFSLVVDDKTYDEIYKRTADTAEGLMIIYDLKDGVNNGAFRIKNRNELLKINPTAIVSGYGLDGILSSRTFIGLILAVSFLVITSLVVAAVAMMLANCISNYIRENMKTLGALKAIGYTGNDIKSSLLIWFTLIAVFASVIGIVCAYLAMPVFAGIVIGQIGLPYEVSFNLLATVIPVAFIILFTVIVAAACSSKISKILPIVALREGIESHNFKKNHVALDKTSLGLNMSLAMKTFFGNMKQNVITFFVVGFMVFTCIISLLMYENFNRHPKLDILATESCAGVVTFDKETAEEGLKYLESRSDVKNIRSIITMNFYYDDKESLFTYVIDDSSKMNNKNLCYTGRLPQHDNEIAVSGAFAKAYGFKVGDEIKIDFGDNSFKYLITGFIQTTNNNGREAIFTFDAVEHLVDMDHIAAWYWFDLNEESEDSSVTIKNIDKVIEDCKDKYGEHVINTMNFIEMIEGSMTTFKSISTMMLVLMITISVVVIALILFLLIKSLVYHKRKDYGIYKALGYTSGSLMLQTALSFMPSVIASIIVFSIGSYYGANPYMSTFMRAFGLVKCNFSIPVAGVVIIGVGLAIVSFALALLQTRRIRKIEAYNMLVAE